MHAQEADAFILTAIEAEYRAVAHHLGPERRRHELGGALYEIGRVPVAHGSLRVAVQLAGPGNEMTAALFERAASALRASTLLFVGVAGGRRDAALGDVVVADTVYGYEAGRDEESGFVPRVKSWPSAFGLVQRARMVAADGRWQRRIVPPPEREPVAHIGALAAGAKVVGHHRSATGRLLDDVAGDALAVEMEGLGFLSAARANHHVQALVIRGISDLLDDKGSAHDARWQPVAARHAAAFAFELLTAPIAGAAWPVAPFAAPRNEASGAPPVTPPAPSPPRERLLSTRDLGTLAGLLLRVPGLSHPAAWQQLLDNLVGIGVMTNRQPNQHLEAVSLLRTCEAYDGWPRLLETLDALWPGAPAVETVRTYLRERELGGYG